MKRIFNLFRFTFYAMRQIGKHQKLDPTVTGIIIHVFGDRGASSAVQGAFGYNEAQALIMNTDRVLQENFAQFIHDEAKPEAQA